MKQSLKHCPFCEGFDVKIDRRYGTYTCTQCGYVLNTPAYDESSEFRQFALEHGVKNVARAGYSGEDGIEELGTQVAYDGSTASKELSEKMKRISSSNSSTTLKKINTFIKQVVSQLKVDRQIANRAFQLYEELLKSGKKKNRKTSAIVAACIKSAASDFGVSIMTENLVTRFDSVDPKEITAAMKIVQALGSALPNRVFIGDLAKTYCEQLRLPPYIGKAAEEIGSKIQELEMPSLAGKKPQTLAAACVAYIMKRLGDKNKVIPIKKIAQNFAMSESTIEKVLVEIEPLSEQIFHKLHFVIECMKPR